MTNSSSSHASNTRIHKDKMDLTVTNICPAFQRNSDQEARQEIANRLCLIFKKYDTSCIPGGKC